MKKTNELAWLAILTLTAMVACKKADNVVRIDTGLKRDFNFRKGTSWVYRDSSTGIMDTFFVGEFSTIVEDVPEYVHKEVRTSRVFCNTDFRYECFYKLIKNSMGFTFTHYKISLSVQYDKYDELTTINNYSSGSLSIDSVKEVRNDSCLYYLKKGIGFIKISVKNDTFSKTWELQSYDIVL